MEGVRRVKQKRDLGEPEPTAAQAKSQARAQGLVLVRADTASGFKGVYRSGGMFEARANEDGKKIYIGHFGTPEAAAL
eukprot:104219-Prymnesium_polylepis.1